MMASSRNKRKSAKGKARSHPNLPRRPCADPNGRFPRVPPSMSGLKRVFVTCHYCGYSPSRVPQSGVCPKCTGHSWERFTLPVRILEKRHAARPR